MEKGLLKNIIIAFLLAITLFSIVKYGVAIKEKRDLLASLNQLKAKISSLEAEKQVILDELNREKELQEQLSLEKLRLKANLKAVKKRLAGLFSDLAGKKKQIENLNSRFLLLKAENLVLIKRTNKVSNLSQENDKLKSRLNSLDELKKAINELKKQSKTALKIAPGTKQENPRDKIIEGNRGFLIKNRQITYPAKVKIEVAPASEAQPYLNQ